MSTINNSLQEMVKRLLNPVHCALCGQLLCFTDQVKFLGIKDLDGNSLIFMECCRKIDIVK